MTLRNLNIFLAVYETGSTTAAAEKLYLAQPSISVAIAELEKEYGVPLFERGGRRLTVTESGELFYQYARHILDLCGQLDDRMQGLADGGTLRIGASITIGNYYLPGYVREMAGRWPQTTVRAFIENTGTLEAMLLANQLDAAVWEGDVHNPSLVGREIGRDHLQMICSPEHPLARHGSVAPQVLCMQNFLLREKGSAVRDLFDLRMGELGLAVEPLWESVSTQAIVHAVAQDIGVSVLPYALVRGAAEQRRIACVEIDGLDLSRKLRLVYRKNKYISPQLHSFFEIVAGEGKAGAARHEAARK